jgi:hypothetical protein
MGKIAAVLTRWQLGTRQVHDRMSRAPTPRARECRQARWLLAQGWSASQIAGLLERDARTAEVQSRCRRKLHAQAEAGVAPSPDPILRPSL